MKFNFERLRVDMISKRIIELDINMDVAATQIGISKATLSRVESRKNLTINNFGKCWLRKKR